MGRTTVYYFIAYFVLFCWSSVQSVDVFRSCLDVLNSAGRNSTKDGEYTIFLENKVGVSIYCHDFDSGQPKEFLTLRAERSSNFASYYANIGSKDACTDLSPVQVYPGWGNTGYTKLRLNTRSLVIDTTDFTFTKNIGPNKIRYGRAGDKFSSSPVCEPLGAFVIDLRGTPFSLVPDTKWAWFGNYSRGNALDGQAMVKNKTYLGCWQNGQGTFQGLVFTEESGMTQYTCVKKCRENGIKYAGLESGVRCYCPQSYDTIGLASDDECNKPCSGDPYQICGGTSHVSVYSTEVGQNFEGRCGGYPGYCFPTTAANRNEEKLQLRLVDDHPCLSSPCKNEGKCVADSYARYHCICYEGYGGPDCKNGNKVLLDKVSGEEEPATCPAGYQPLACECDAPNCTGAHFLDEGNKCRVVGGNARIICGAVDPGHTMLVDFSGTLPQTCPSNSVPVSCTYYGYGHDSPHNTYGKGGIIGNQCNKIGDCRIYNSKRWGRWGCNGQVRCKGAIVGNQCSKIGRCTDIFRDPDMRRRTEPLQRDMHCTGQVRCKVTVCNCGAYGHCNLVTGECECDLGYYGERCELFDYCAYYENLNNVTACMNGGICRAVYKKSVAAFGGDKAGESCIFPFDYKGVTFTSCVQDDTVGPPFACGGEFGRSSYAIDLGKWNPGNKYTIAAWVRPETVDTIRRTVVGGVQDCNDFGFNLNSGTFRAFLKLSKECTRDLDAGKPLISVGQWYMVAVTNNATHMVIYQNGEYKDSNTEYGINWQLYSVYNTYGCSLERSIQENKLVLMNHYPTTAGFQIGGEVCCPEKFRGWIRTVKVWKRALSREEINRSMYNIGTSNSTVEALHDGLVGHWELADSSLPPCAGIDHGGVDWTLEANQVLSGIHCNISRFYVPKGVRATIMPYNGTGGGKTEVTAKTILIDGVIDGSGAGYRGAKSSSQPGAGGIQGESFLGPGRVSTAFNGGGGGGGEGAAWSSDGMGHGGGGGSYRYQGAYKPGYCETLNEHDWSGSKRMGHSGNVYGDTSVSSTLYLGSGGGSGGNALDLSKNPKGGFGGDGGGAIKLTAEISITVNGLIEMNGLPGQGDVLFNLSSTSCPSPCKMSGCQSNSNTDCWDHSGPGGGGSGGTIYLAAKYVNIGVRKISALGGLGGAGIPSTETLRGSIRSTSNCGGKGGDGKILIESVVATGKVQGFDERRSLSNIFYDHSQAGQMLIDPLHTVYGNEIYWGCFSWGYPTDPKTLGYAVPLTTHIRRLMTPDYCIYRCREQGYKYSGTQNGQECFCDNHLSLIRKVHDSVCNISCDGDPLQMCGGENKLQIFGPPPSSPAMGTDIVPKCEPWCVTADQNTDNPKWGLCSEHEPVITDWKIRCDCPPGKTGMMCDQLCPRWTYGTECKKNCTCFQSNTAYCESSSGACQCKAGFQGPNCNVTCNEGFFGQDCKSPCNCSNHAVCDPVSGACKCRPGWMGVECQFPCPKNTFGVDCNQTCSCNHGSCNPEHGQCQCDPGYKLPTCFDRCDPSNYGQDCGLSCDCNGQFCYSVTGLCRCGPGYIGNKCDIMCPHGTWGQGCHQKCPCQNGFGCDHVTGECRCGPGFIGEKCDMQCSFGRYGSDCLGGCTCIMNQTSTCNAINGACLCLPGFYGYNCEKPCTQGFYGEGCKQICTCLHGAKCDPPTGKCECAPGFTGNQCETPCSDGRYGKQCHGICSACPSGVCSKVNGLCICKHSEPCICPEGFWGSDCSSACSCVHGTCDPSSGACRCYDGWQGTNCDQICTAGKYGPGCRSDCKCIHGTCDSVSGTCFCKAGFTNSSCSVPCESGRYGPDCRFQCQPCAAHAYPGCDPVAGNCLCSDGYTGPLCDRPCPMGTYGRNCSLICSCNNGGLCDSVTGKCTCPAGFTGTHCELKCPSGTWGVKCAQTCDCGLHGLGCSPDEGVCICKSGFTGVKCRESCPVNTYGNNCSQPCHCDPIHGRCSPVDGSCFCDAGWSGTFCDMVCDADWWGRGCTQQCQCNGRGTCSPFTGICDCDEGYLGPACDQQCKQDVFWGNNCANKCDCGGGHCDHRTGKCTCPPGRMGHHCENGCDSNHFGFLCAQLCGCQNNARCNPVTGFCTCQPGWSGQFCTESCPEGYFGVDCSQLCPPCLNGGSCDTFTGLCKCLTGFTDPICNTSTVPVVSSSLTDRKTLADKSGVNLTVGQLVGLIVGLILFALLAVILAVIFTRRKYMGRFGSQSGAMKFQEEVEIKETQTRSAVAATTTGFINPVIETGDIDDNVFDSRSEISETTSGVASNAVESDDDDDKNNYFKDSAA